MKKIFLSITSLAFTVAVSAQIQQAGTAGVNAQKHAGNIQAKANAEHTGNTTIQSAAVTNASAKSKAELAAKKELVAAKKEQLETNTKSTAGQLANKEVSANASFESDLNVRAAENQAAVNGAGSINTGTAVSLNQKAASAIAIEKTAVTQVATNGKAAVQKTTAVTTAAQASVASAPKQTAAVATSTTAAVATRVKAKPAVKVKTHVTTVAGVQLR